jgi:hypothetical protein
MLDSRSPLAVKIMEANPEAYQSLVVIDGPSAQARELLNGVRAEQLLSTPVKSPGAAAAMLGGFWLWHDGLEECHQIVQKSPAGDLGATYSFWHAIMHRREGDFSNSKYWYAKAGRHPIIQSLAGHAGPLINRAPADKSLLRLIVNGWSPDAFVDFVESVGADEADVRYPIAVQLQQLEWRVLFEHCAQSA